MASAAQPPAVLEKAASPDGRLEIIVVLGNGEPDGVSATAKIRAVKTRQLLAELDWRNDAARPDAATYEILWNPDSENFALKWDDGWSAGLYAVFTRSALKSVVFAP